jgi:hypothetical protein
MGFNNKKRSNAIWLLAHNEGDEHYKSAVQQFELKFPLQNTQGIHKRFLLKLFQTPKRMCVLLH